jgi:alkyl hydroperoxide reductase subunit AhpC
MKNLATWFVVILLVTSLDGCKLLERIGRNPNNETKPILSAEYKDAGDWTLPAIYNREINLLPEQVQLSEVLKDPKIKCVLVTTWATWGEPCTEELPYLEDLFRKYKDKGFLTLAISIDTGESLKPQIIKCIQSMKRKKTGELVNITYPILWDIKNVFKDIYGLTSMPVCLLIDKNNKIVYQHSGFTKELIEELDAKLAELMP